MTFGSNFSEKGKILSIKGIRCLKAKADQFTGSEVPMTLFLIILCGLGLTAFLFWLFDGEDETKEDRRRRELRRQSYRYSDGSNNIFHDSSHEMPVWHHNNDDGEHDAHNHGSCGDDGGDGGDGGGFDGDCGGGDF